MKIRSFALAALLAAPLAPASAQTPGDPGKAAREVYDWCLTLETGSVSECACVTGFYAGATAEDEFQIFATSLRFSNPQGEITDVSALLAALTARQAELGMTEQRFEEIMTRFADFGALGEKADAICMPVEAHVGDGDQ